MLVAERPLTSFIWRPDALSFVVAFLAGIAGMLSLTTTKSGALVGVLISVTTVPAAANASVALAYGVWDEFLGSTGQLALNVERHRRRRASSRSPSSAGGGDGARCARRATAARRPSPRRPGAATAALTGLRPSGWIGA